MPKWYIRGWRVLCPFMCLIWGQKGEPSASVQKREKAKGPCEKQKWKRTLLWSSRIFITLKRAQYHVRLDLSISHLRCLLRVRWFFWLVFSARWVLENPGVTVGEERIASRLSWCRTGLCILEGQALNLSYLRTGSKLGLPRCYRMLPMDPWKKISIIGP